MASGVGGSGFCAPHGARSIYALNASREAHAPEGKGEMPRGHAPEGKGEMPRAPGAMFHARLPQSGGRSDGVAGVGPAAQPRPLMTSVIRTDGSARLPQFGGRSDGVAGEVAAAGPEAQQRIAGNGGRTDLSARPVSAPVGPAHAKVATAAAVIREPTSQNAGGGLSGRIGTGGARTDLRS